MEEIIQPQKSKAVRAGAGAGKTYNLTHEVIDYALDFKRQHQRWPHVVVTTFTRKATQELSERLVELALSENKEALEFVTSPSHLKISTIHGLLDHFLKSHGHEVQLASDFSYLNRSESKSVGKRVLKDVLEANPAFMELLGVYKFSQLHDLLQESLQSDLSAFHTLSTSHLNDLLRQFCTDLGSQVEEALEKIETVLDESDKLPNLKAQLIQIKSLLGEAPFRYNEALDLVSGIQLRSFSSKKKERLYPIYEGYIKPLASSLRQLQNDYYNPMYFPFVAKWNQLFFDLRREYLKALSKRKMMQGQLDMSDLEPFSLQLIRQKPHAAKSYSMSWDYWLVDEFQDTSPVQVEILKALIGNRPYYMVGDPQQSIYLFRGARSEVFERTQQQIKISGGESLTLEKNYRSHPSLLKFMNYLCQQMGGRFHAMIPREEEIQSTPICSVRIHNEESDDKNHDEVLSLCSHIAKLIEGGSGYGDICVLARKHSHLQLIAEVLKEKQVPVLLHSGGAFWARREVVDALSLLKVLINPYDYHNLACLLRHPLFAISDNDLQKLFNDEEKSPWEMTQIYLQQEKAIEHGRLFLFWYKRLPEVGVVVAFQRLLVELGYFDFHMHLNPNGRVEGNLWKIIHLLTTYERERGANYVQFLNDAIRSMEQEQEADAAGAVETDKVNIMTVHASKGLQFEHVLIPFMGQKPFLENSLSLALDEENQVCSIRGPLKEEDIVTSSSLFEKQVLKQNHEAELNENLRVFYVAFTRAKSSLYLSWTTPVETNSWASLLDKVDTSEGAHEMDGFIYMVDYGCADHEVSVMEKKQTESVRDPFQSLRQSYHGDSQEESAAVTSQIDVDGMGRGALAYQDKQRGIRFHRLLQTLKYPSKEKISELVPMWFPKDQDSVAQALSYLFDEIEIPLATLIQKGQAEWAFVSKNKEGQRVEGQIDLWAIHEDELWIVDYKSGRTLLEEKAFDQLNAYKEALVDYLSWDKKIRLVVVYPFLKKFYSK